MILGSILLRVLLNYIFKKFCAVFRLEGFCWCSAEGHSVLNAEQSYYANTEDGTLGVLPREGERGMKPALVLL